MYARPGRLSFFAVKYLDTVFEYYSDYLLRVICFPYRKLLTSLLII